MELGGLKRDELSCWVVGWWEEDGLEDVDGGFESRGFGGGKEENGKNWNRAPALARVL
jgi:hypothetical protein